MVKVLILFFVILSTVNAGYTPPSAMSEKLTIVTTVMDASPISGSNVQDFDCGIGKWVASCGGINGTASEVINCKPMSTTTCKCVAIPSFSTGAAASAVCFTAKLTGSGI